MLLVVVHVILLVPGRLPGTAVGKSVVRHAPAWQAVPLGQVNVSCFAIVRPTSVFSQNTLLTCVVLLHVS